jgi:hypothetical protein
MMRPLGLEMTVMIGGLPSHQVSANVTAPRAHALRPKNVK